MDPLDRLPKFMADVRTRLEMGRKNYKDESFEKMPSVLALEIREELLDIVAWGFILDTRLDALREWITSREEKQNKR